MKKRILSILLTLVMVIGMLPMASLTAHAAVGEIETITDEELLEVMEVDLRIGNEIIANSESTGFSKMSNPGHWELKLSKQDNTNRMQYYIVLHLYDYDVFDGYIDFMYDMKPAADPANSVSFQVSVHGDCKVGFIRALTTDKEKVYGSSLDIIFAAGATLRTNQISHRGTGQWGSDVELNLRGVPGQEPGILYTKEIINSYYFIDWPQDSEVVTYADNLIIINYDTPPNGGPLFTHGEDFATATQVQFTETVDLFLNTRYGQFPIFEEHTNEKLAQKYQYIEDDGITAFSDLRSHIWLRESGDLADEYTVGDSIYYYFFPELSMLDFLFKNGINEQFKGGTKGFKVESSYELTNLSQSTVVASDTVVGAEEVYSYEKDNFVKVAGKNGEEYFTFETPGLYELRSSVKLMHNGNVVDSAEEVYTFSVKDLNFKSITPTPTSSELSAGFTDLGTANLGAAETDITFAGYPTDMPDGWTTGRSITVTRDGVEIYNKTYADNELFGWNLKDNIDEGGTYRITLKVFAQKGSQTLEKTHTYQINVKGSTIKTIALTGVGTPVIGKAPSTINTVKCNTDGVVVKRMVWTYWTSEMGGTWLNMPSGGKFEAGKRYAVEFELQTADGYSFTAKKEDMTVYINGEVARKSINYSSSEFAADLEFTPITTPTFTTQPVGGEAPNGGTYTVNWATNFTPVKIVVGEYNFRGSVVRGTEYSGDLTSIALKPNTYGYAIIAYYNDDYAAYSSRFTITEAPIIEIKTVDVTIETPVEGNKPSYNASVPADAGYTVKARYDGGYTKGVMWETNGEWMHGETKFAGGQDYVFTVLIQPKVGYEFYYAEGSTSTEPDVTVTVNGEPTTYVNKDSTWLIVQYRFTVKGITLTGSTTGGVKVAVENLKNSATLIVAQYDGGRMVDVQTMTVSTDGTYTMNELTHKTGCTYKAFLVNSTTYAPLCAADDF